MTYWNEKSDSHIRLWDADLYQSYKPIKHTFTEDGYRGDILQPSMVVYLGTCDVMTNLPNPEVRWNALIHIDKYLDQPFISLGTVGSGVPSMVRRLYSYIQNFGAPKYLYMTIPRFDGYEFVNKSGKCYNVSTRMNTAKFLKTSNFIDDEEFEIWKSQLIVNKQLMNKNNTIYILEERFAFIETICKAYDIDLKWSFNLSDGSVIVLYRNIDIFQNISDFMKKSFVGLAKIEDQVYDRSMGEHSHRSVYNVFNKPLPWDFEQLKVMAEYNYNWMHEKYKDDLIKGEY